jgi:hypothetical protein
MESSTAAQHAYGIVVLNVVNCNARYSDSAWPDPTHASGSSAELVFAHQEAHLHQRTFITPLAQAVQLTSQHNVRQRPHLGRGSYGRRLLGHQQLDRPNKYRYCVSSFGGLTMEELLKGGRLHGGLLERLPATR